MAVHGLLWMDELPGEASETGWRVVGAEQATLDYEAWAQATNRVNVHEYKARRQQDAMRWVLADLLAYGEDRFGEDYAQILMEHDYSIGARSNMMRIARKVPLRVRHAGVRFWDHYEVMGLTEENQLIVLGEAAEELLKRDEIRALAKRYKALQANAGMDQDELPGVTHVPEQATCPICRGAGTLPKEQAEALEMEGYRV